MSSREDDAVGAALRRQVRGEVATDAGTRALYTMDASNYRRVPDAVVAPLDADDLAAALAACRAEGLAVVPRGGGTSIGGQATGSGVVLDTARHLDAILGIDPDARTARVQPGVVLDDLRAAAAPYGLTFGPDPSTHGRCTLGGMIGNNSCGAHSVAWGKTADNVESLDVITYRGERLTVGTMSHASPQPMDSQPTERIHTGIRDLVGDNLALLRRRFPPFPRRVSGYGLDHLLPENGTHLARALVGSEGTLATVVEATVRLVPAPAARALAVLGFADEVAAAEAVPELLGHHPLTVESLGAELVALAHATAGPRRPTAPLPPGDAWLFVEAGGATVAEAAERARAIAGALAGATRGAEVLTDSSDQRALWRLREDAAGTATRLGDVEAWPGWEDTAVPPDRLPAYLRDFRGLLARYGLRGLPYGHFGEGCIHIRIDFDLISAEGVAAFRSFSGELADLVVGYGGSLSGEHGDGLARSELLPRMYGPEVVRLFEHFKDLWDPDGRMNPGVVVRPRPIDENLRFAVLPREPVPVEFAYPHDGGDFAAAVRRCVGVGRCRETASPSGTVMCPSYRVTRDERHSTRGRARLLHEMLAGELVTDGWRSPEVKEALDLCLGCRGCRTDCPVSVDIATYKAEFLHHHYDGRLRPASHYALGYLPVWVRAAAVAPGAPAALGRTPLLGAALRRSAGIDPRREVPALAPVTFTRAFRRRFGRGVKRQPVGPGRPKVLLWPDTFTNFFSPRVGAAAVRVLHDAGLLVVLPPAPVCCGLTWVSTGQLDVARAVMRRTLDVLAPAIDAGVPVVGLEPSCASALAVDLPELLGPADPRAARLAASVRTLAGALAELAPEWTPPRLDRPVVGQVHCHQHAVLGTAAEEGLMARAGLSGRLARGCCGLAGNFGVERGHYEVSVACAEEELLPAVRSAPDGALVLADGFSCRTQLADLADVPAVHLAEALARGLPSA